jgi:hypothetical protein
LASRLPLGAQDAVCALAVHGGAALSAAGGRLGVSVLRGAAGGAPLRPARLTHAAGRGGKEKAAVGALALLPASRLLLVGAEDGTLRLCV